MISRHLLRYVCAFVAVLGFSAGLEFSTAGVAGAAPLPTFMQFNMYGTHNCNTSGSCVDHTYNNNVDGYIIAAAFNRPNLTTFSLNETCGTHTDVIWNALKNYGWSAYSYAARSSGTCHNSSSNPSNNWYGNSIFFKGASFPPYTQQFVAGNSGYTEKKGFVCVLASPYWSELACSIHTRSDNVLAASAELTEFYNYAYNTINGNQQIVPVVLGDFNLPNTDPSANNPFSLFRFQMNTREALDEYPCQGHVWANWTCDFATFNGPYHFDYLWIGNQLAHQPGQVDAFPIFAAPRISDHAVVFAYF